MVTIGGLSAHAGQTGLLEYARASKDSLENLILVHGEEFAASAFMAKLNEEGGFPEPVYAEKDKHLICRGKYER